MDTYKGPSILSLVCSYVKLYCMVDFTCVALGLTFDDDNKQKQYETILFSNIRFEVENIKL
jgi:hypothetical protein